MNMNIWILSFIIFLVNFPFGYWRSHVRKLSFQWFLAVHIPVPFVIILRLSSGLGWQLKTVPLFVGAFFLGQLVGGRIYELVKKHSASPVTACLFCDILRFNKDNKEADK